MARRPSPTSGELTITDNPGLRLTRERKPRRFAVLSLGTKEHRVVDLTKTDDSGSFAVLGTFRKVRTARQVMRDLEEGEAEKRAPVGG